MAADLDVEKSIGAALNTMARLRASSRLRLSAAVRAAACSGSRKDEEEEVVRLAAPVIMREGIEAESKPPPKPDKKQRRGRERCKSAVAEEDQAV